MAKTVQDADIYAQGVQQGVADDAEHVADIIDRHYLTP